MIALLAAAMFSSCSTPYAGACKSYLEMVCDVCPQDGVWEELPCTCMEEGTLSKGDYPNNYNITDKEAEMSCTEMLIGLDYPSPDEAAYCKQELEFMKEYEEDSCDDGGGYYSYDSGR